MNLNLLNDSKVGSTILVACSMASLIYFVKVVVEHYENRKLSKIILYYYILMCNLIILKRRLPT